MKNWKQSPELVLAYVLVHKEYHIYITAYGTVSTAVNGWQPLVYREMHNKAN